jgi:GNAT superfamily N-acetyltransferase
MRSATPPGIRFEADATLAPREVNAAYAWVEWPQRDEARLAALSRSCTWFAAREEGETLVGVARLLDDGGLHAALWDVIVRPDRQGRGIGRRLVEMAVDRCRANGRRLIALVSTPAAVGFFAELGFVSESHGHVAMYLRPHRSGGPDIHTHEES